MKNPAFELASNAMTSLEIYRGIYFSGEEYQRNFQEMLGILRINANNFKNYGDKKFLLEFADALESANKTGKYKPRS